MNKSSNKLEHPSELNTPKNAGTNTNETIVISLIRMLIEGPDVSLNGSPTVSPTTAAACAEEPFPPCFPPSIYFLALSQAPPALLMKIAIRTPLTNEPARSPPSASIIQSVHCAALH